MSELRPNYFSGRISKWKAYSTICLIAIHTNMHLLQNNCSHIYPYLTCLQEKQVHWHVSQILESAFLKIWTWSDGPTTLNKPQLNSPAQPLHIITIRSHRYWTNRSEPVVISEESNNLIRFTSRTIHHPSQIEAEIAFSVTCHSHYTLQWIPEIQRWDRSTSNTFRSFSAIAP